MTYANRHQGLIALKGLIALTLDVCVLTIARRHNCTP